MNNVERSAKNGNGDSAPKKFLFVSFEALSGDLAWKVQDEGHKVKCWIQDPDDGDVYDGFLEKVEDWNCRSTSSIGIVRLKVSVSCSA